MGETSRQFSLQHQKHETKMKNTFYSMLLNESLVDVILSCDSSNISAHRLILSANSSYFKTLFDSLQSNRCQIPIIVLKDIPMSDLNIILEFMYRGEVSVDERQLPSVLKSAEVLEVFGLTEVSMAFRSRINSETTADQSSTSQSSPSPNKRPRISDGVKQLPQHSTDVFSKLSSARFQIRPPPTSPIDSLNGHNSGSVTSTAIKTTSPSLVKNIIIPLSQIHRKSVPDSQSTAKQSTPIPSPQKSLISYSLSHKTTSGSTQQSNIVTKTTNRLTTSIWKSCPSQQKSCQSLDPLPSTSQLIAPIEVPIDLIEDETNEMIDDSDRYDIKPPIFELNNDKNNIISEMDNDSNLKETSIEVSAKSQPNPLSSGQTEMAETSKTEVASNSRQSIKSRSSSVSSQSSVGPQPPLPPPPSYRLVERSKSRLLRNMIKPTAMASTSAQKSKENSEEKNKTSLKKERQSVRLFRQKLKTDSKFDSKESSPEIECPSCGLKFNDEKKWNQHIKSAHMSAQT